MSGPLKMAERKLASQHLTTFKQRVSTDKHNDDRRKWKSSFWKGSKRTISPYRAVNTFHHGYKNQSANGV
jgi:hypothetical protein